MASFSFRPSWRLCLGTAACLLLAACGGGGSTSGNTPAPPDPPPSTGGLTLLAGNVDGQGWVDADNRLDARFFKPKALAADTYGNLYVADTFNHTIRKIASNGKVTTLAGNPGLAGSMDGQGGAARFRFPYGVAVDASGTVYVSDTGNNTIRKITAGGVVSTYAGAAGPDGGYQDGARASARFAHPRGLVVDGGGNVFVADEYNNCIRKIASDGTVSTLAGQQSTQGTQDGTGSGATFTGPTGLARDAQNNLYVADADGANLIRKVSPAGVVTTVAGIASTSGATNHSDPHQATFAFYYGGGLAVDGSGNIYVGDEENNQIRVIATTGQVSTLAGNITSGSQDGSGSAAGFYLPEGLAVDPVSGNLLVADCWNNLIRSVTPAGAVTTFSGARAQAGQADGSGASARFTAPYGIAVDASDNAYVVDSSAHTIRKITSQGVVSTFAGTAGTYGHLDGQGTGATFYTPWHLSVDASGTVFVAEFGNSIIRRISSSGSVSTLAGIPLSRGSADGAALTEAAFNYPCGVASDASGNLWIADTSNHVIRKLSSAGQVSTPAGTASGSGAFADGSGASAAFSSPRNLIVDPDGNILIADSSNHCIRKLTVSTGQVTTLAGSTAGGSAAAGALDGTGNAALFSRPQGLALDKVRRILFIADQDNHAIRKLDLATGQVSTVVGRLGIQGVALGTLPGGLNYPVGVALDSKGNLLVTTAKGVVKASPALSTGF